MIMKEPLKDRAARTLYYALPSQALFEYETGRGSNGRRLGIENKNLTVLDRRA
jgi:hypothetical protein